MYLENKLEAGRLLFDRGYTCVSINMASNLCGDSTYYVHASYGMKRGGILHFIDIRCDDKGRLDESKWEVLSVAIENDASKKQRPFHDGLMMFTEFLDALKNEQDPYELFVQLDAGFVGVLRRPYPHNYPGRSSPKP